MVYCISKEYNPNVKVARVAWLDHQSVLSRIYELFFNFSNTR